MLTGAMRGTQVGSGARRAQTRAAATGASAGVSIITSAVPVVAAVATLALSGLGLWQRGRAGELWPTILTDWSLGSVFLALSAAGVGAVLAHRLPRNVVGWLFVALGPLTAFVFAARWYTTVSLARGAVPSGAVWSAWLFVVVIPVNMTLLILLALLFPHGRALSRRWRVAAIVFAVNGCLATAATMVSPYIADQTLFAHLPNPAAVLSDATGRLAIDITTMVQLAGLLAAATSLVLRLRRARGRERQQVKWFVFAVVAAFTTYLVGFWVEPLFVFATLLAFPAVPVAAAVAVLRYRLYDIDRVLNRTLVYALLTGFLALAYVAAITAIRPVTTRLAGDSAIAVAASTLAAAALFRPVRNRIQHGVDRRFNRARYDAAATVDALRTHLRDDVDLDSLQAELTNAVRATMQPAGTTLWLREAER